VKERKRFFFEKKKQKTFGPAGVGKRAPQPPGAEVFCFFFSKKHAPGSNRGSAFLFLD
jgi:hypothetical protein